MADDLQIADQRARGFELKLLVGYLDKYNIWTTAIGFNIERGGADEALRAVGADITPIWREIKLSKMRGLKRVKFSWGTLRTTWNEVVTDAQAEQLFANDLADARRDLADVVPGFEGLPQEARLVLIDMRFQLGPTRFRGFLRQTVPAICAGQYAHAADCIAATPYATVQVPKRAEANIQLLRRLAA